MTVDFGGDNFIPDTSTNSHVTAIVLGTTVTGAIYTINIEGDGVTRSPTPPYGCSDGTNNYPTTPFTIHTLTVPTGDRIIAVDAYRNIDWKWYAIIFRLKSGGTLEYHATHSGTDTLYTFTLPVGHELTGFYASGDSNTCNIG